MAILRNDRQAATWLSFFGTNENTQFWGRQRMIAAGYRGNVGGMLLVGGHPCNVSGFEDANVKGHTEIVTKFRYLIDTPPKHDHAPSRFSVSHAYTADRLRTKY